MSTEVKYVVECIASQLGMADLPQGLLENQLLNDFLRISTQPSLALLYVPNKGFKPYRYMEKLHRGMKLFLITKKYPERPINSINIHESISIWGLNWNHCSNIKTLIDVHAETTPSFSQNFEKYKQNPTLRPQNDQSEVPALVQLYDYATKYEQTNINSDTILQPLQEVQYWQQQSQTQDYAQGQQGSNAKIYFQTLHPLVEPWKQLLKGDVSQIEKLIKITCEVLDTLCVNGFSSIRLQNFLSCCNEHIVKQFLVQLHTSKLWNSSFSSQTTLLQSIESGYNYWKDSSTKFIDDPTQKFDNWTDLDSRINNIQQIFAINNALRSNHMNMQSELFFPYSEIAQLQHVPSTDEWPQYYEQCRRYLANNEQTILEQLHKQIFNHLDDEAAVFQELKAYGIFFSLPFIKDNLKSEMLKVQNLFEIEFQKFHDEYLQRSGQLFGQTQQNTKAMSKTGAYVDNIIWSKKISAEMKNLLKIHNSIYSGKEDQTFTQNQIQLLRDLKDFAQEQLNKWLKDVQQILKNQESLLEGKNMTQLMKFDEKNGLLNVTCEPALVSLKSQGDQLAELGYFDKIQPLENLLNQAQTISQQAFVLKKIANYYTNLDQKILPCQKQLLLSEALHFESIVNRAREIGRTGSGNLTLPRLIRLLQNSYEQIQMENDRIQAIHSDIVKSLCNQISISFMQNQKSWQVMLGRLTDMANQITASKDPNYVFNYFNHLDAQLFKIVQMQLNHEFKKSSIKQLQLVSSMSFDSGIIQLSPSCDALRQKFYQYIDNLFCRPVPNLKTLNKQSNIFSYFQPKNEADLSFVYKNAERTFQKIEATMKRYTCWARIMQLQAADVQTWNQSVKEWEESIEWLRMKRVQIQEKPETEDIEGLQIYTGNFKTQCSEHIAQLIDSCLSKIKENLNQTLCEFNEFQEKNLSMMKSTPTTVEEITATQNGFLQLKLDYMQHTKKAEEWQQKKSLLWQIPDGIETLQKLEASQKAFEENLKAYEASMAGFRTQLQVTLTDQQQLWERQVMEFEPKWKAFLTLQEQEINQEKMQLILDQEADLQENWTNLQNQYQSIKSSMIALNAQPPLFQAYLTIETSYDTIMPDVMILKEFQTKCNEMAACLWLEFRKNIFSFQDFTEGWISRKGEIKNLLLQGYMTKILELYKHGFPYLRLCIGEIFELDHWHQLFTLLQLAKGTKLETLKFGQLLEALPKLTTIEIELKQLIARASAEIIIKQAISDLQLWCNDQEYVFVEYVSSNDRVFLITEWQELLAKVADMQNLLLSLKDSPYIFKYRAQIHDFEERLGSLDELLIKLNLVQRKWVYLEPVFTKKVVQTEANRFLEANRHFRQIMTQLKQRQLVITLSEILGVDKQLIELINDLEICQKALNAFLAEKRDKFPRFFFLGDDDMLEILGQAQNPSIIQQHLKKLFAGINRVVFSDNEKTITSVLSSNMEEVSLLSPVQLKPFVEEWLQDLDNKLTETLKQLIRKGSKLSLEKLEKMPEQIQALIRQINWCQSTEQALVSNNLPAIRDELNAQLQN